MGARRAAGARGARRRGRARARRPARATRRPRGAARSSASRSSRGSTATPSSSRSSSYRRVAAERGRAASPRGSARAPRSRRDERDERAARRGRTSIRATRARRVAVLAEEVADARAVAVADARASAARASCANDERGVVLDPRAARAPRARGSRSPRPTPTACPSRARAARRSAPTRSTSSRRRKIVYEIARFQRLSSVSSGRVALPRRRRAAVAVAARPVSAVERRLVGERARDALEQAVRVDAVVVGERDDVCLDVRERRRCARGRGRVASAGARRRARWPSSDRRRRGRPRSGRRRAAEARVRLGLERAEQALELARTRPTVATTRSNDGSSCGTRRRLRDVPCRAAPLVSVLLAVANGERVPPDGGRERPAPDASPTSSCVVVDDGSTDATPDVLAAIDDPRLVVLRNEERLGLAGSLNRALDEARGRYVARLDADDVALPRPARAPARSASRRARASRVVGSARARDRRRRAGPGRST